MALIALCLWVVIAWVAMVSLTAKQSWPAAYILIAAGLPIVIWLGASSLWLGLLGLVVMAVVLRWPLRYLGRWIRGIGR